MMGQRHAEILRATPGATVSAVCDRDSACMEKIANGAAMEASYDSLLERADVDAVVLCLPSGMHADFGIRAARAGKHVVTEKPIDIVPAKGRQLAEACAAAGVQCAVISQNRFADGAATLKKALVDGVLGQPVLVEASVKWFRHDEYYAKSDWRGRIEGEGGGVIMNQAIHTIDLLLWFFGEPEAIYPLTQQNRPHVMETEDTAVAAIRFPKRVLCVMTASTSTYPGFQETIRVHGPTASCTLESGVLKEWKHSSEVAQPEPPKFDAPTEGLSPKFTLFQRQYRNILNAIAGQEKLLVTADDSIAVVQAGRAFYEPVSIQ
jgi:predicted dehydrogenase